MTSNYLRLFGEERDQARLSLRDFLNLRNNDKNNFVGLIYALVKSLVFVIFSRKNNDKNAFLDPVQSLLYI